MLLVGKQQEYTILNLSHYIRLSYIAENFLVVKWKKKTEKSRVAAEQNYYLTKVFTLSMIQLLGRKFRLEILH